MEYPLEIITPARRAFSDNVDMVTVPTEDGTVGVLAGHTQLFTVLSQGEVKIVQGNKEYFLAIGGGFMQVDKHPDKVTILVSRAVHASELNEAEITKAIKHAKDAIKEIKDSKELANAQALLRRSMVEMKVLTRRRRTGTPAPTPPGLS